MSDSTTTTRLLPQRRLNRFSILDNEPVHVWAVAHSDRGQLSSQFHLTERVAEQVAALAEFSVAPITALASLRELNSATRERVRRLALFGHDSRLVITDVEPVDGRIMSDKPFALSRSRKNAVLAKRFVEFSFRTRALLGFTLPPARFIHRDWCLSASNGWVNHS